MDFNIEDNKFLQNQNKYAPESGNNDSDNMFLFSNGKIIDSKDLKRKISLDYSVFKRFDKDNNSIFDDSEIVLIQEDLANCKLSENEEVSLYASVTGLSVEKASIELYRNKAISSTDASNSEGEGVKKTPQQVVISRILNSTSNAMEIFNKFLIDAGAISKGYNSVKDFINSEYSGKRIVKEIYKDEVSAQLLMIADSNKGMSAKEYIETKMRLLNDLLKASELSDKERGEIFNAVKKMNLKELNRTVVQFAQAEGNDIKKLVDTIRENALKENDNITTVEISDGRGGTFKYTPTEGSIEAIMSSEKAQEKLSFEDVFELEREVKFNKENIEKYEEKEKRVNNLLYANNIVVQISQSFETPINNLENLNKYGGTPSELDNAYKTLETAVLSALHQLFGDDEEAINEALQKYSNNAKLNDGIFDFGLSGMKYTQIVEIAKNMQNELKTNLNKMLGNQTLEQLQLELKNDYQTAYGPKESATELALKFQQSQQEGIGYAKMGTTALGVVVTIASDGVLLPLTGGAMAILGSPLISYAEAKTKAGGITAQDKTGLKNELIMSGVLTVAGFGVGNTSAQIGKILLEKCPKLVAYFVQYGSDAVMMALTDYAITGELNLTAEGIGELMNILAGVAAHHKIHSKRPGAKAEKPSTESKTETIDVGSEKVEVKVTEHSDGTKNIDLSSIRLEQDIMASQRYVKLGKMEHEVPYNMSMDRLPAIQFPNGYVLDLNSPDFMKIFLSLGEGEQIVIGREGHISIADDSRLISRKHVVIYKQNGQLKIVDISKGGTKILTDASGIIPQKITSRSKLVNSQPYELNNLPTIKVGNTKVDLSIYEKMIKKLEDGQYLTLGRNDNCNIPIKDGYVSSIHLIIYKENGMLKIKDISTNGTYIIKTGSKNPLKHLFNNHSFTTKELNILNAFAGNPKVSSILSDSVKAKQFVKNVTKILNDKKITSPEIKSAIENGIAEMSNDCGIQKCSVDKNVMNDIVKLATGEDYICHYNEKVSSQAIMAQTPVGDVVNWCGQLFVNNGEYLQRINMSEKTFRKLFPPISRFSMHQGNIGTCYLVSGLEKMYSSPKGRAMLYNLIGEDSSGIYTLTYNSNGVKTYFRRFDSHYKHVREENGLAILEQGYCKNTAKAAKVFNPRETLIMDLNDSGRVEWALEGLIGRKPNIICGEEAKANQIRLHANNPNAIINCATIHYRGSDRDILSAKYNVLAEHEYSIKGYNPSNDSVIICNPHHSGLTVEIPMNEFLQYFNEISILIL